MRIIWHGGEDIDGPRRAAVEAQITAGLGPIPTSSIYVVADRMPMEIRVIARSPDMERRLGRAAFCTDLSEPEVRVCMTEIVAALVRDWSEIADLMRGSKPA